MDENGGDDATRTRDAMGRIERWLSDHLPEAREALGPPASEEELAALEAGLGRPLPVALRTLLSLHDGELGFPGAFPDGQALLSCAEIEQIWRVAASIAAETGQDEDAFDSWKALVEDGIIFIHGPVKPNGGSPAWIPFSSLEGSVIRFVDFDPAPGGRAGQVIEVDQEGCLYRVLADSLADFLTGYADELEAGTYTVGELGIASADEGATDPTGWPMPEYLAGVSFHAPRDASDASPPDGLVFEGEMGFLMGGPETLFGLVLPTGEELAFLARPELTKGYRAIAVGQKAGVRARPCPADRKSVFVDQMGTEAPDYVALEYRMLR